MKKMLLIFGILSIIACILVLIFAFLIMHSYYHLMDGTPEHYISLRHSMNTAFITAIVLAVIGAACFIVRAKI